MPLSINWLIFCTEPIVLSSLLSEGIFEEGAFDGLKPWTSSKIPENTENSFECKASWFSKIKLTYWNEKAVIESVNNNDNIRNMEKVFNFSKNIKIFYKRLFEF